MTRKGSSYLWFILIIVGGIYLAISCTDSARNDLGDTGITTPTDSLGNPVPACADLPQNDPRVRAGECVSSRDILDKNRDVDNPALFGLALLAVIIGILGVTGQVDKLLHRAPAPAKKPGAYLLAPLFLQDTLPSSDTTTCDGMVSCHPVATTVFAILLGLGILGFVYGRKRAAERDRAAGRL